MSEHETHGPENGRRHLFDDPRNVDRLLYGFYAVCLLLVGLDFVIHRHVAHPWEQLPVFHALYGFGSCWILVVIAKQMRRVLMRDEDYYEAADDEASGA